MDKKFKVFVIIALIILAGVAGTSTFVAITVMDRMGTTQTATSDRSEIDSENLVLMDLSEPITVNIVDAANKSHVARVVLALEVDSKNKGYKAFIKTFGEKEIVVRDAVIALLRDQPYEMMSQVDAQEKLAEAIVIKVNELLGTTVVQNVYFGDFFVQ